MVTIYDIAKKMGYAPATVSKALNNKLDISEKTRAKIQQCAKEMGYSPNSQAVALSTKKTWNIGVLSVDIQHSGLTHYMFSRVLDSIKNEAESHGYDITFISENIGGRETSYLEHAKYRRCDGVIIACIDFDKSPVEELVNGNIPVVVIDHDFVNCSSVSSDNADGMRKIVYYLKAQDYHDLVYFHGEECDVTVQRRAAFIEACNDFADIGTYEIIAGTYYSRTDAYNKTNVYFQSAKQIPSAIIYSDDYSAIGGMQCIRDLGYKIPDDIVVIGYDGIELGELITPSLTTVRQDTKRMGQLAVSILIREIEDEDIEKEKAIVPVKLIERDSSK